jgi:acyl-CoA oxidase
MFLTFLKTNASKEQQKLWLPLAQDASYFGAYAQTELGHGSNVRGLETTATFDKDTDEFIIHSPTLTSMKWWPTGMYACTHAVVFANLVIHGISRGTQGFFVQLRDHTGSLMKGVEVGEIGPKIAGSHSNIGYARFNEVRVPRFNMFMKLFKVTREGEFIAPPPKVGKIKNISMMMMRVFNVAWAARDTSKAATIAIRYSCVRKQGFKDTTVVDGAASGENTIMDYSMQQYRTLKALSLAYMLFWNVRYLNGYLADVQMKIASNDESAADELPELHVTCAGLKAFATVNGHADIEECRKACGGQGFLRSSGVADLSTTFSEPVTVEGEQVILSLQVGRFLMKSVRQVLARGWGHDDGAAGAGTGTTIEQQQQQPAAGDDVVKGSVTYLLDPPMQAGDITKALLTGTLSHSYDHGSTGAAGAGAGAGAGGSVNPWAGQLELLVSMLKDRARRVAYKLEAKNSQALHGEHGMTFDEATNATAILSYKAAFCHSSFVMARNNLAAVEKYIPDEKVKAVLLRLLELQILIQVREDGADWIGLLQADSYDQITDRIAELLAAIRPDCVPLVDAFGHSDYALKSTLGRFDGNVYEAIYEGAKRGSLNEYQYKAGNGTRMVGWDALAPIFDLEFLKRGIGQRCTAKCRL